MSPPKAAPQPWSRKGELRPPSQDLQAHNSIYYSLKAKLRAQPQACDPVAWQLRPRPSNP